MVILYDASNVHNTSWARRAPADLDVGCVSDIGTLDEVIGRADGIIALVRTPQEDRKLLDRLRLIRTGYPLKFVILVAAEPQTLELLFTPDAVLSLQEGHERLWQTVRDVRARGVIPRLTDIIRDADAVPPILRVALIHALLRPTPISSIKELAAESGCDRRTLPRVWELVFHSEQDRLIDFLDWILLLYATGRKTSKRSWMVCAREIGITEDTLSRSARKLVGLPLGELSTHGQVLVLARFQTVFERLFGRWPDDVPSAPIPPRPRYRVLVVDDHSGILQFIDHTLRRAGFEVSLAVSASEALLRLDRDPERPTVVLADIRMPGIDGIELARRVVRLWPAMRIVLMSAFVSVDVMDLEGWREDMGHSVQFLSKPFTAGRVIAALREACEAAAAIEARAEAEAAAELDAPPDTPPDATSP